MMAGQDFGGKCYLTFSDGKKLSLRAAFKLMGSRYKNDAITNQDGSVSRTVELVPYRAEIEFEDKGINLDDVMLATRLDITGIEEWTGVTHLWTDAFMVGEPNTDRASGNITGLTIHTDTYNRKG